MCINIHTQTAMNMEREEEREFQVQETTILPQRTGMSLLMFDLCCAKPRMRAQRKPGDLGGESEKGSFTIRYVCTYAGLCVCVCVCVCVRACVCMFFFFYVYMYVELGAESENGSFTIRYVCTYASLCVCVCVCVYLRIYVCRAWS
jgi:hypothetical protein